MARPNLFDAQFEYDDSDPDGFRCAVAALGKAAGGSELSVRVFELPPDQHLCPYHYEFVEEWLLVLDGEVDVRTPRGHEHLKRGDVMCFAAGPDGAHRVTGRGNRPAHVVMFSSAHEPSVAVYPDSDKIGVWTGNEDDNVMLKRRDGHVPYFEGETP